MTSLRDPVDLVQALGRAQELGFLGPGPIEPHIEHAERFLTAWIGDPPTHALDLGSGGGLPGLVLAQRWPLSRWIFLDANQRRTSFLVQTVDALDLGDRVEVERSRAEDAGHDPGYRAQFDLVTARSFGPPAVTAECAAPFLRIGGVLMVSEPPDGMESGVARWDREGVARVGLALGPRHHGCQLLRQEKLCDSRYPRRVGIPAKRPIF